MALILNLCCCIFVGKKQWLWKEKTRISICWPTSASNASLAQSRTRTTSSISSTRFCRLTSAKSATSLTFPQSSWGQATPTNGWCSTYYAPTLKTTTSLWRCRKQAKSSSRTGLSPIPPGTSARLWRWATGGITFLR